MDTGGLEQDGEHLGCPLGMIDGELAYQLRVSPS
jgi:hypothetical protein